MCKITLFMKKPNRKSSFSLKLFLNVDDDQSGEYDLPHWLVKSRVFGLKRGCLITFKKRRRGGEEEEDMFRWMVNVR